MRLFIFAFTTFAMVIFGIVLLDVIQEGVFHRLTAYESTVPDSVRWQFKKEACISAFPFAIGWIIITAGSAFVAFKNASNLFRHYRRANKSVHANHPQRGSFRGSKL